MNERSSTRVVFTLMLFVLILVCTACGNEQVAQKVEKQPAPVSQDALVTDVIDSAKSAKADKEQPAPEKADYEQPVAQAATTVTATTIETATKQSPSVVDQVVAPVDAAPTLKPSDTEPSGKVVSDNITEASAQSTITISITSNEKKGVILEPTSVLWEDGDSVLDVLKRVTKSNKITLEYKGAGMLSYVEGIANVYEFDEGTNSGWLFKINGKYATRSAGAVKLSIGDNVEWIYSIKKDEDLDE